MEKQTQLLTLSQAAYDNKEYDKVIDILEGSIRLGFESALGYCLLGQAWTQTKQYQKAVEAYEMALKCDVTHKVVYYYFGDLLAQLQRYGDALQVFILGVKHFSNDCHLHNNIGKVYERLGKNKAAHEAYKNAFNVNPRFVEALNNSAILLYKEKKYAQASEMFRLILKIDPNFVEGYSNLGASLHREKKYDEAIKVLEIAIEKQPTHAGAYTNLGNVYNKLCVYDKAQAMHEKSIALAPKAATAYANLGSVLNKQGEVEKAVEQYKKALEINPYFVNAHFDLSTALLSVEAFEEGFSEYEWRFKKEEMIFFIQEHKDIFSKPMLQKTSDALNKTVLVHSEQGFGDSLMCVRFIPEIKKRFGCKIVLKARDELCRLLENNCQIDEVVQRSQKTPAFDFHLPIMSVMNILGIKTTQEFFKKRYIFVESPYAQLQLPRNEVRKKIGICWSASSTGESFEGKVFDLRFFEPLVKSDAVQVYSLQLGESKYDIVRKGFEKNTVDLTPLLIDFKHTAMLVKQLDLVITSDTSVAHLCGALGVKTWVLLQKYPDWRWGREGEESYMYESVKLIRQTTNGNWQSVFQTVYDRMQAEFKLKL